jgi:hypothetical protein
MFCNPVNGHFFFIVYCIYFRHGVFVIKNSTEFLVIEFQKPEIPWNF